MSEYRGLDFLDYVIIIVKHKVLLITLGIFVLVSSYLSVRFFIDEEFDSEALIVSVESDQLGGLSSLLSSFSDLPIGIPGISGGGDYDMFTTIIYSRTNLRNLVDEFGLFEEYGHETMMETLKELTSKIIAGDTKEGAYQIVVRSTSPQKSVDMVNYIVKNLNTTMIELNIAKSRENRLFLEKRYNEIKEKLKDVEDSLVIYQNESGILLAEDQAKSSFEVYSQLEAELAAKQIESSVMIKLYGEESPNVTGIKLSVEELEKKLADLKSGKDGSQLLLSLNNLPEKTMQYLRHFRDVTIYNKMLEFIIPLYEQSKLEEQKQMPMLQVIDEPVLAEKKSYPPRTLFALIFTSVIMFFVIAYIISREVLIHSDNPKVQEIKENFSLRKSKKA